MKITDFEMLRIVGRLMDKEYLAEVTVTTTSGHLWWKRTKTERRQICRRFGEYWYFADTGELLPDFRTPEGLYPGINRSKP